jgi:1-deoxy-D-xylulose-5-phosphate synthase
MQQVLDKINSPQDIKKLSLKEMEQLASEIREKIIHTVSNTGGHLGPSLGVVELTIALHFVLDSPKDRLIWDVGHQAYAHKIICGRKERFHTLRQYKGIAGFPKRCESCHDIFDTGHTSTSISAALGIAEARDLKKENYQVVAVIGDGALTGGLAFEGLNNVGYLKKDMTIVLNDNKMSISPNVGSISEHLKRLSFISHKDRPRRPIGSIFEKLGFKYFGPIDGHDLKKLIEVLKKTKEIKGPKVVHVLTVKGKGYPPAEETPEKYHGVGAFDVVTGKSNSKGSAPTYTKVFADTLTELGEKDERIVAITAAMPDGTGVSTFGKKFPKRFYDVGIAEQHAVTFSAGLAINGMKPFAAIYSTFLQRAFDQIIIDVAMQNLPVRFCLDRGGLVGEDGETHHGAFDLSYLRCIPNMVVMSPKDENELRHMINTMASYDSSPIAVRYPRGKGLGVEMDSKLKKLEIGEGEILKKGKDISLIALGNQVPEAMKAAEALEKEGVKAEVINARFVKPLDKKLICASLKKTGKAITVEENALMGGFGSAVVETIEDCGLEDIEVKRMGLPDKFIEHGSQQILRENLRLDAAGIFYNALQELGIKKRLT